MTCKALVAVGVVGSEVLVGIEPVELFHLLFRQLKAVDIGVVLQRSEAQTRQDSNSKKEEMTTNFKTDLDPGGSVRLGKRDEAFLQTPSHEDLGGRDRVGFGELGYDGVVVLRSPDKRAVRLRERCGRIKDDQPGLI
jgi:hypothetical protein